MTDTPNWGSAIPYPRQGVEPGQCPPEARWVSCCTSVFGVWAGTKGERTGESFDWQNVTSYRIVDAAGQAYRDAAAIISEEKEAQSNLAAQQFGNGVEWQTADWIARQLERVRKAVMAKVQT